MLQSVRYDSTRPLTHTVHANDISVSTVDLNEDKPHRTLLTNVVLLPVTIPLRIASSLPLVERLVPSFARPAPLDDVLGLPLLFARAAVEISVALAIAAIFSVGALFLRPLRSRA